jgi:putative addiction module antidote
MKVISIGNSLGVVLSAETLAKLGVKKGDELQVTDNPVGVTLSAYDARFAAQMEAAEAVMRADRDVLRELSKR